MASKKSSINEDDSFIILGTSPGTSLDLKCNGVENGQSLDKSQLDDALKDLPPEASVAFKAHFQLEDGPSPASVMVASTIITDDKSTEELQKHFGELLDENIILKETLKHNNDSMKEQFLLIASCQEDMLKTHMMHKEKFDETRELVKKLRQENNKLKQDITRLVDGPNQSQPSSTGTEKSGPSSALEFVTSPDDDTINKLTAQLDLVEKQRRQVIVDNEKLNWQKESLEHIVDAITKERDDLKEKIKNLELQLSNVENDHTHKLNSLNNTIRELNNKLQTANSTSTLSSEEVNSRDAIIKKLEGKMFALQNDLKAAQLKILELESVKLEFTKYKSGMADTVKMYKEQLIELHNRLKDAQTTMFQPVRFSVNQDGETSGSEYSSFMANVKLYDKTLKHLADLLNLVTHGASDSLVQSLGVVASLHDYKLERTTAEQFKNGLGEMKQQLEKHHSMTLNNIGQVRCTLTIFEGIFKEYNELLKKVSTSKETKLADGPNVEALTAALVARGQEINTLNAELKVLRSEKEDTELLKTQLDLYRSDFEAEREAREKMACQKENVLTDLRNVQKRNQELVQQLEEIRKLNPNLVRHTTQPQDRRPAPGAPGAASSGTTTAPRRPAGNGTNSATGNLVYTCPKCTRFSSDQYKVMEDHFDFCLDDF